MTDEVKQEQEAQPARTFTLERKKRVAIVGCADSKTLAPWNNAKEWEFWGVNNLHLTIPKAPWTRWFELHSFTYNEATGKYARRGKEDFRGQPVGQYLASLQALNIPGRSSLTRCNIRFSKFCNRSGGISLIRLVGKLRLQYLRASRLSAYGALIWR